ncbi:hypothetical protein V8C43DRAFT_320064 [Trichoderma afarasin]
MEAGAILVPALYASLGLLTRPSARQVSARNCLGLNPKCAENTASKRHSPVSMDHMAPIYNHSTRPSPPSSIASAAQ